MGYTTDFGGRFTLTPALTPAQGNYLEEFSNVGHMKQDVKKLEKEEDDLREAVGLPIGREGEFSLIDTVGILDSNKPPACQPGLWCQWIPTYDGEFLEWDGGEKFYSYCEWLRYLMDNIFKVWGVTVSGEVEYNGESYDDEGVIRVIDGVIQRVEYEHSDGLMDEY